MGVAEADREELLHLAREERSADAMYRLGMMFSTGQGVPYNIVTAHKWFNLAVVMGSQDAMARRTELAGEMTPDQIAEAQRTAREWLNGG